ncbi:iron complex outermembrane receptor protein [Xanthomonas campestris]|uniref:TonB-dependent siderophore receptor n=1 Tax=Xanthomonas arboricola TaxID=56448 RepID=A0A2S7ADT9_9XANT|nr:MULTISPECIES: TonB-dependent siderophore receptor [Xanthomonas]NIJ78642.1 iron complex outermembrane receptor protein [Xanthomonas sp. CFBP 8151]PPU07902.1 TonB-dependent siderophore receptor [Xanthomonas arboricola]
MFPRLSLLALALLAATPASASESPISELEPERSTQSVQADLDTVRVVGLRQNGFTVPDSQTGPYRGLDMLDVPANINVVSRDLLDAQGATGLYDALRNVAGVVRQQQSGVAYDQISIRGINLDNRSSYLFNGVLPFDNNVPIPMENKERVEVLKGAAALYYGFVTPGGVVNLVTKRATVAPVTSLSLSGDNQGSAQLHVDLGRRFGSHQQFGVRVNALSQNIHLPIEDDNGYRRMLSAALDWDVSSDFSLHYDVERIRARITEQAAVVPPAAVGGVITLPGMPDPSILLSMKGKDTLSDATTHLLSGEYALNSAWTARFSVGESVTRRDRWLWIFDNYSLRTGQGSVYGADQKGQEYTNSNARANVEGSFRTGSVTHDLQIGVDANKLYQPSFNTFMYRAAQNLYDPMEIVDLIRAPTGSKTTLRDRGFLEQTIRNSGVYAMDRIGIGDRWQLIGALRYARYGTRQLETADYDVSATTPSASVTYRLSPKASVYASYVEGLESGGTARSAAVNAGQALPAAVSRQKEVGARYRMDNGTLFSASLFRLDQASADTDDNGVYALNGRSRYRGLEFSVQGNLTENLSAAVSGMLLDAQIVQATTASLEGNTPNNTPERTASLFFNYRVPMLEGLSVSAGGFALASRPIDDQNRASIPGYTTYVAGAAYATRLHGVPTTFKFNVENLTDKRYWSAAGSGQLAMGLPRTISFNATFDF